MARKQSSILWQDMGGSGGLQIPDRVKVICPECDEEIGQKSGQLAFFRDKEGNLEVGIACPCTPDRFTRAKVEYK